MNVPLFTVSGFIRSLKRTWSTALVGTPVAPFAGLIADTPGGCASVCAPVVNVAVLAPASALPPMSVSCAPATIVYAVFGDSAAAGVKVRRRLPSESAIEPSTDAAPANNWRPAAARIASSGSLNWTMAGAFSGTPVVPSAGLVAAIVGASVSAPNDVVNEKAE